MERKRWGDREGEGTADFAMGGGGGGGTGREEEEEDRRKKN